MQLEICVTKQEGSVMKFGLAVSFKLCSFNNNRWQTRDRKKINKKAVLIVVN